MMSFLHLRKLFFSLPLMNSSYKFKQISNTSTRFMCFESNALSVHEVTIKSCGTLYENWRKTAKFAVLPDSDLTFNVKYLDNFKNSNPQTSAKVPVVVALHGAPGSCTEYSNLAEFLHNKNVRVVAPTFPDFSSFRPGIFKHTAEEKAQYVTDFLQAHSVPKVDLLVCHSSAVYPGLLLCLNQNIAIKSVAMLNAGTFSLKMPAIRNFSILKLFVRASENSFFLKIMEVVGPTILQLAKVPVRVDKFLDPLLSATVMARSNILKSKEKFHQLASAGFPIFYAFSENDKLIGRDNAVELACLLGAKSSDMCYIDKNGDIEREGHEKINLKVMCFENGSHYVFWKYSDIINAAVYKFLAQQINIPKL